MSTPTLKQALLVLVWGALAIILLYLTKQLP